MTAVIVPASVAGSKAPQGTVGGVNFAIPGAVILVDRRPANTAP
jgi:hypothetical protein